VLTSTNLYLIAVAGLVALATWVSLHALTELDLSTLPARSRIRITWCVRHNRQIYLLSAAVAVLSLAAIVAALLT
jgi:hypothetical protein